MNRDVIIACDFPSMEETLVFLKRFDGYPDKPFVKIGMELFYSQGPDAVRRITGMGHRVFLDLKLHDIPNTVKRTMSVLRDLQVDIVNVHASGTVKMMQAALEGLTRPDGSRRPGTTLRSRGAWACARRWRRRHATKSPGAWAGLLFPFDCIASILSRGIKCCQ